MNIQDRVEQALRRLDLAEAINDRRTAEQIKKDLEAKP